MLQTSVVCFSKALFCATHHFKKESYLLDSQHFKREFNPSESLTLPLVVDTEYVSPELDGTDSNEEHPPRFGVTSQFLHPFDRTPYIFVQPELAQANEGRTLRHAIAESGFHVVDFLQAEGIDAAIERDEDAHTKPAKGEPDNRRPLLQIVLYAHFMLVDLTMIVGGSFYEDVRTAIARKRIIQTRRLSAGGFGGAWYSPWVITMNGVEYRVALKFVDTVAVHGAASYKDFCANSGVKLDAKDNMGEWIKRMDVAYFEVPELFDAYAIGDLLVYDALSSNAENMRVIWKDLGILDYYKTPSLSIGATVDGLFTAKLLHLLGVPSDIAKDKRFKKKEFFKDKTISASAEYLSQRIDSNLYLLSKCDGGRCRNFKPTTTTEKGALVDIDIGGAYASAMSVLTYPVGEPLLISFDSTKLSDFLAYHRTELLPGLWYARISTTSPLEYEQDLIPSWFDFKRTIRRKQDSEGYHQTGVVNLDSGETKLFTRVIKHGTLTSDLLDCIELEWNPRQKDDFFSKVVIEAIGFYPASLRVETAQELINKQSSHDGRKDYKSVMKGVHIENSTTCHNWYGFSLGSEFIDVLKVKRSLHPKKTPLNELFKLVLNTLFGDSVSRYFQTANMIIGSNITAKVRSMMWYSEKALFLAGSITDGQIFDLNKTTHKRKGKYLNKTVLPRLYTCSNRYLKDNDIAELRPLFGELCELTSEGIKIGDKLVPYQEAENLVNSTALEHVQAIFPHAPLLNAPANRLKKTDDGTVAYTQGKGVFIFEMKKFLREASYHGSANYRIKDPSGKVEVKMRSYEGKREHQAFLFEGDDIAFNGDYKGRSPALVLMDNIALTPKACPFLPPFEKSYIIKPNDFANRYNSTWNKSNLGPGDTAIKCGMPRYFSIAQFTFQSPEQYKAWKRESDLLQRKYGVSFELLFINKDGTLNYQNMITTLDRLVREGITSPKTHLDPHYNYHRNIPNILINYMAGYKAMRERIKLKICGEEIETIEDYEDWE